MIRVECPKCSRRVTVRKDGNLPKHKIRRYHRYQHAALSVCPASGTWPFPAKGKK